MWDDDMKPRQMACQFHAEWGWESMLDELHARVDIDRCSCPWLQRSDILTHVILEQ